jgi:hypothetical protein
MAFFYKIRINIYRKGEQSFYFHIYCIDFNLLIEILDMMREIFGGMKFIVIKYFISYCRSGFQMFFENCNKRFNLEQLLKLLSLLLRMRLQMWSFWPY